MTISLVLVSALLKAEYEFNNNQLQAAPESSGGEVSMSSDLFQCIKTNAKKKSHQQTSDGHGGTTTTTTTLRTPSWFKFKSSKSRSDPKMDLVQVLAINALELTAPAAFFLRPSITCSNPALSPPPTDSSNRRPFIQVSGHPGSLAPAGPHTLWKKQTDESTEIDVYEYLSQSEDPMKSVIPKYHGKKIWNDEVFLELEDLLNGFGTSPAIMDIKMGSRTFMESEVSNSKARTDLYQKMVKVDPTAPTEEEVAAGACTKLRYMKFREEQSSTSLLSFRIEAIQFPYSKSIMDVKTAKSECQVGEILDTFIPCRELKLMLLERLKLIRNKLEKSEFFMQHEVIGSSLLIVHDTSSISAHLIDFAKTVKSPTILSHCKAWDIGNHEDGYLDGLSNLIRILESQVG